jgi:hypothetical protein
MIASHDFDARSLAGLEHLEAQFWPPPVRSVLPPACLFRYKAVWLVQEHL